MAAAPQTPSSDSGAVFRCDGSATLGTGHVQRCCVLAAELARRGWRIGFSSRDLAGAPLDRIRRAGYALQILAAELTEADDRELTLHYVRERHARWLIVDRYAARAEDLKALAECTVAGQRLRVLAIDDICEQPFPSDVLLNQNANATELDYETGIDTRRLLGPRFALLASAYSAARRSEPAALGPCRRILVFMGGGDAVVAIERVLHALAQLPPDPAREIRVILGAEAYERRLSSALAALPRVRVEHGHPHLAEPLSWADLLLSAGGTVAWEACCLGVPMVILSLAANQELNAAKLHQVGAAIYAGKTATTSAVELARVLGPVVANAELRRKLGRSAWQLVDGLGAQRVADVMAAAECV